LRSEGLHASFKTTFAGVAAVRAETEQTVEQIKQSLALLRRSL